MKYINSFVIAFSMYSKIPMPKVEWKKENMKYVMCFFPWVGAVSGLCFFLWGTFAPQVPVGRNLYAAILTVIPILVTGGIHMDGFLDTMDALSSWQTKERRLEILKDSNAGAFAVISGCMYFLAWFGLASELGGEGVRVVSLGFFLSRCLSGYSVTSFPCAKDSGLVAMFSVQADRKWAGRALLVQAFAAAAAMLRADLLSGAAAVAAALFVFCWYHRMSMEKFGGITGDLAGWFLQMCELMVVAAVVVADKIF